MPVSQHLNFDHVTPGKCCDGRKYEDPVLSPFRGLSVLKEGCCFPFYQLGSCVLSFAGILCLENVPRALLGFFPGWRLLPQTQRARQLPWVHHLCPLPSALEKRGGALEKRGGGFSTKAEWDSLADCLLFQAWGEPPRSLPPPSSHHHYVFCLLLPSPLPSVEEKRPHLLGLSQPPTWPVTRSNSFWSPGGVDGEVRAIGFFSRLKSPHPLPGFKRGEGPPYRERLLFRAHQENGTGQFAPTDSPQDNSELDVASQCREKLGLNLLLISLTQHSWVPKRCRGSPRRRMQPPPSLCSSPLVVRGAFSCPICTRNPTQQGALAQEAASSSRIHSSGDKLLIRTGSTEPVVKESKRKPPTIKEKEKCRIGPPTHPCDFLFFILSADWCCSSAGVGKAAHARAPDHRTSSGTGRIPLLIHSPLSSCTELYPFATPDLMAVPAGHPLRGSPTPLSPAWFSANKTIDCCNPPSRHRICEQRNLTEKRFNRIRESNPLPFQTSGLLVQPLAQAGEPYTTSDKWLPDLFLKASSDGAPTTSWGGGRSIKPRHWCHLVLRGEAIEELGWTISHFQPCLASFLGSPEDGEMVSLSNLQVEVEPSSFRHVEIAGGIRIIHWRREKTRIRWTPWRRMFGGCGMAVPAEKVGENGEHGMKKVVSAKEKEFLLFSTGPTQGNWKDEFHGWEKYRDEVEGLQTWRLPVGGRSTVDPAASVLPEKKHRIRMKGVILGSSPTTILGIKSQDDQPHHIENTTAPSLPALIQAAVSAHHGAKMHARSSAPVLETEEAKKFRSCHPEWGSEFFKSGLASLKVKGDSTLMQSKISPVFEKHPAWQGGGIKHGDSLELLCNHKIAN
ncbi:hypothetical protein L345_11993, partial [Ophiophagus hannah]